MKINAIKIYLFANLIILLFLKFFISMKKIVYLILFIGISLNMNAANPDSLVVNKIYMEALADNTAYTNLEYLCTQIGGRLCGSVESEKAIAWAKKCLEEMALDTVYLQKLMVSHWTRGEKEVAYIKFNSSEIKNVHVCALGESVATPKNGITAEVVEVKSFEELIKLGKENISGKIVFYNRAMDPSKFITFEAYGGAAGQRFVGAVKAAEFGAVGVVVRSLTLLSDFTTHTGIMKYDSAGINIPAVAISTKDADLLSESLQTDKHLLFYMKTSCQFFSEKESYNVIGEIKGTESPNEIMVVGGHLDSWDNGQGAHDDGVGVVQSIEVLRIFKKLGVKPKHTIRVVLFMDEECHQRGGKKYAEIVKLKNEKHIVAIESDGGGFTPNGFSFDTSQDTLNAIKKWSSLLLNYGLYSLTKGHSGVDIGFLKGLGFPLIGLETDSQRYFDFQHAETDTFDKVNKRQMQLGSAAMASLIYLIDKNGIQ